MKRLAFGILGFLSWVPLFGVCVVFALNGWGWGLRSEAKGGDPVLYQHFLTFETASTGFTIEVQPWMRWAIPLVTVGYGIALIAIVFGRNRRTD